MICMSKYLKTKIRHMSKFKYYVVDYMTGIPREIYRGYEISLKDFGTCELWRAKKDGSWSSAEEETRSLFNLWLKGDFDPEDDEISETQAMDSLAEWRNTGSWPGRE